MRLTLRTLLAYRDDVLSQENRDELHVRIQQSQDATNLLHRVDSVTSAGQLVSPQLSGSGLGGDANTIAEYLDDSLHGPIVPELERVCLESDIHLAELAHCHRLLATALRTQVEVPERLKSVALGIGDAGSREELAAKLITRSTNRGRKVRVDSAESLVKGPQIRVSEPQASEDSADSGVNIQAPMIASGGKTISEKGLKIEGSELSQQVPEYLVGAGKAKWKMPVLMLALAVLLVVLLQQSLGPWQRVKELFAGSQLPAPSDGPESGSADNQEQLEDSDPTEASNEDAPEVAGDQSEIVTEDSLPPGVVPPADPSGEEPGNSKESEESEAVADVPITDDSATDDSATKNPEANLLSGDDQAGDSTEDENADVVQWNPRDTSESTAVAFIQSEGGQLNLAELRAPIAADSTVIIPPTMRTKFDLRQGLIWLSCGPSMLSIDSTTDIDVVKPKYCQALVSGAKAKFALETQMGKVIVEPQSAQSIVSVDYRVRREKHGSLEIADNRQQVLVFVAAEGKTQIEFRDEGGQEQKVELGLGEALALFADKPHEKFRLKNIPNWFRTSLSRAVDEIGIEDFRASLAASDQQDLRQTLEELAVKGQPETAALAMQTLVMLGEWKSASSGLFSPNMRSHWRTTLDLMANELGSAVASDNQLVIQKTKKAFSDAFGNDGAKAFSLMLGPDITTPKSLGELISLLEDSQIALRVLAAYQLKNITGESYAYQAHAPNRSSIQTWRRQLATKKLKVRDPNLLPENQSSS